MGSLPTEEDLLYMQQHIDDTTVLNIIVCCSLCSAIACFTMLLRVWSRFQGGRSLIWSDWLVVSSVVFFLAFCTIFALSTRYGAGRHILLILQKPEDLRMLAILNILNPILYGIASALVKWSILALYLVIFPPKFFRYWCYGIGAINTGNAIAIVLVSCLQCRPLELLWNPMIKGTCINFSYFSVFNSTFNFALDMVILLSPIPLVSKLNLSKRKKVLLCINFALGGSACIVAAIRVPYARKVGGTVDPSWDMIPGGLLCVVEVMVALTTACLPTYRPVFEFLGWTTRARTDGSGYGYRSNSRGTNDFLGSNISTHVTSGPNRSSRKVGISITDDISMMRHAYKDGRWVRVSEDEFDDARGILPPKVPRSTTTSSDQSLHSHRN